MRRDLSMDILRILAAISVVLLHTAATYMYGGNPESPSWQTANIFNSLTRFSVPVFIMLSGAFFLQKEIPIRDLYLKYIKRLFLLLFIWNFCYNITTPPYELNIRHILACLFSPSKQGHHLWFMYMLIGLYMLSPFFKKITDSHLSGYFLILWIAGSVIFNGLDQLTSAPLENLSQLTDLFFSYIPIGYAGYFVLGYYLYKQQELSPKSRRILYTCGIAGIVLSAIGTSLLSKRAGGNVFYFYDYLNILTVLTASAIFVFVRYGNARFSEKTGRFIKIISDLTLGVYLVHILVLRIAYHFAQTLELPTALAIPAIWVVTSICSFIIVFLFKKLPVARFLVQ